MRPAIVAAKVEKLAAIIEDGNDLKDDVTDLSTPFQKQADAAREVLERGSNVAEIEAIELPSER